MRVKDMPRHQQKAVFASMTDDRYLATLEGAEKLKQRKSYLLKRSELSDDYENKIFKIYNDSKLTHRQKMGKIAGLKKEAKKKLDAYQDSGSVAGEIRADNWRKFRKKYNIEEVPVNKKSFTDIAEAPLEKLIEERMVIEKRNEVAAREKIRSGVGSLREGIIAINKAEPGELNKAVKQTREANREINKGRAELVQAKRKQHELEKTLAKEQKKSFSKDPVVRKKQMEKISQEIATDLKEIEQEKGKCPHDSKNLSFKGLKKKGIYLSKSGDADKDGVKNSKDCRPLDKKKQDLVTFGTAAAASFVGSRASKALDKKKKKGVEQAGKRRYGVYWSGERVGSHETKAEAQADIKERVASGRDAEDYELVLESYQGSYIKTLKN